MTFGCSLSSKKSWLGDNFPAYRIQDLAKAVNSELYALSPSNHQNAFETWHRLLELCVQSLGVYFKKKVNVVGKSGCYFLFYWPADITEWTTLVLTFSHHVASIFATADINVGNVLQTWMQWLMSISCSCCKNMKHFNLYNHCAKSMECTPFFLEIGVNDPQAILSTKVMKFNVLKGGKWLLRKS